MFIKRVDFLQPVIIILSSIHQYENRDNMILGKFTHILEQKGKIPLIFSATVKLSLINHWGGYFTSCCQLNHGGFHFSLMKIQGSVHERVFLIKSSPNFGKWGVESFLGNRGPILETNLGNRGPNSHLAFVILEDSFSVINRGCFTPSSNQNMEME